MNQKREYIRENLDVVHKMIEKKRPKFEIARVLGVKYVTLEKYLKEFGINYKGNPNRKGIPHLEGRTPVEEYLNGNRNITAPNLRNKLIESGLKKEMCECCGLSEWMGKKIPLELHHKNMNHNDNRLENLQILCSNCHSLAHEYCNTKGKPESTIDVAFLEECLSNNIDGIKKPKRIKAQKKEKTVRYCKHCGKELTDKQKKYCSQNCAHSHISKTPTKEELMSKLDELKWNKTKTGRYFGVSDAAIIKWIKKYEIKK